MGPRRISHKFGGDPNAGDDFRTIGRRPQSGDAAGNAFGQGAIPSGVHRKRGHDQTGGARPGHTRRPSGFSPNWVCRNRRYASCKSCRWRKIMSSLLRRGQRHGGRRPNDRWVLTNSGWKGRTAASISYRRFGCVGECAAHASARPAPKSRRAPMPRPSRFTEDPYARAHRGAARQECRRGRSTSIARRTRARRPRTCISLSPATIGTPLR